MTPIVLTIVVLTSTTLVASYFVFHLRKEIEKKKCVEQKLEQIILDQKEYIDEIKKEQQLTTTMALLFGEETERHRLAQELHHGLGGLLSCLKLNLSMLGNGSSPNITKAGQYQKTLSILNTTIHELRNISQNLIPDYLHHNGIKKALSYYLESISSFKNPEIYFNFCGGNERYSKELELSIFRITQELVNNAMKYAEAKLILVNLYLENDHISLQVIDNGVGFDVSKIHKDYIGHGIYSIENRIKTFGGSFKIISEPADGTEVIIEIALNKYKKITENLNINSLSKVIEHNASIHENYN